MLGYEKEINRVTNSVGLALVMGDGGDSVKGEENLQEIKMKQLVMCQFLCGLLNVRVSDPPPSRIQVVSRCADTQQRHSDSLFLSLIAGGRNLRLQALRRVHTLHRGMPIHHVPLFFFFVIF